MTHLYLASASPRRHELLLQAHIPHEVLHVPASGHEDEPILAGENAVQYVQRTALEKVEQALWWRKNQTQLQQHWPILCADTTVELHGEIIDKPDNLEHAAQILQRLSGHSHQVHSACCLAYKGKIYQALSSNTLWFDVLSPADIEAYCQSGEPLGKAGAYGIQSSAALFIKRLEGSYSSVMGLDLHQTHQLLLQAGLRSLIFQKMN